MKVWVFVEGESDRIALNALWMQWQCTLRVGGWGIQVLPLDDKARFFRKIGPRTAEKLAHDSKDLVVGLPDLYPTTVYDPTEYKHANLAELQAVQKRLVAESLQTVFRLPPEEVDETLKRFYPTAFKHDLEVLILAAKEEFKKVLGTPDALGKWRHPVEEQNHNKSPKYVVAELFYAKRGQQYRDTIHAKAVLSKVQSIRGILFNSAGQLELPAFKATMDWIAEKTGVKGY